MKKLVFLFLLVAVVVGCASGPKLTPPPPWVSGAKYMADAVQGVGMAPPMVNPAAQRGRAAHQARLALAQTMRTRVAGLVRDWINENQDYFTNAGESLSYFEATSEELTSATLVGSEIREYYKDADGNLYALAIISKTDAIQNMMDKMKKLSAEQTKIIQERAEEGFKKLEERLEKANW